MSNDSDSAVQAYLRAAAPPGSLDAWALVFAERNTRPAAAAALALGKVVFRIALSAGETDVRRLKLMWWREEAARLRAGEPRHPLGRALHDGDAAKGWVAALEGLVDAVERIVGAERDEAATLRQAAAASHRQILLAAALGPCDDAAIRHAHAAGTGIRLTEVLGDRAPGDETERLASHASDQFTQARQTLRRPGTSAQRILWVQATLHEHLLQRMLGGGFSRDATRIPAVRALWTAWRGAREAMTP